MLSRWVPVALSVIKHAVKCVVILWSNCGQACGQTLLPQVLAELLPGSQERMAAFVTEGGHVVVLELLTGDIPWLVMPTLRVRGA